MLSYIDLTMVVEFRVNQQSKIKDVAGCKMRLNQKQNKLENIKAVDFYTKTSAYDALLGMSEDSTTNGQNWSLTSIENFNNETEFYCQDTHCYVTCNLTR